VIDEAESILNAETPAKREFLARLNSAVPALVAVGAAFSDGREGVLRGWRNLWRLFLRNRQVLMTPQPLLKAVEVAQLAGIDMGPRVGDLMRDLAKARVRGEIRSHSGARRLLLDIVSRAE